MRISNEKQRLATVGLLLLWCTALIAYRLTFPQASISRGLLWNLFLATIPLVCSAAFQAASARNRSVLAGVYLFLWLLFLPNAPYILTDLIHLKVQSPVPLWYQLALFLSCAGTGTLLGYLSLLNVHSVIEQRFSKTTGWAIAVGALMLCGFGIYVGRFLRWNSWDAFTRPVQLLRSVLGQFIDPGPHPHPIAVTLVFSTGLIIGYLALRVMAAPEH
jgi:uncharacterized membrane protein